MRHTLRIVTALCLLVGSLGACAERKAFPQEASACVNGSAPRISLFWKQIGDNPYFQEWLRARVEASDRTVSTNCCEAEWVNTSIRSTSRPWGIDEMETHDRARSLGLNRYILAWVRVRDEAGHESFQLYEFDACGNALN